ncbi:hypothetical protein GCM10023213_34580 [Prosthecobacter algae]|uniref:Uncharacterized protein n=1 Tax=Prosthecobacter algae TaxID=1144682 RepID=A0ABP9PCJ6_9BACT
MRAQQDPPQVPPTEAETKQEKQLPPPRKATPPLASPAAKQASPPELVEKEMEMAVKD